MRGLIMTMMVFAACTAGDDDASAGTSSGTEATSTEESSTSSTTGGSSEEESSSSSGSGGSSSEGSSGSSSGSSESGSGSSSTGEGAEPWANCDEAQSCGGGQMCIADPLPGEGPGLQWCAEACDPDGDGAECPDPPPGSEVTKFCFDLHDGTGACALGCIGGYDCPGEMTCFNGNLCLYES